MLLSEAPPPGFTTRFAPAPTGFLHLGHVASALAVWGVARAFRGRVFLRIEDHDRTRSRPEFERAILDDLEWLGFTAAEPPIRQSDREPRYRQALSDLESRGLVYACRCSRKSIVATHGFVQGELRYPGTCRDRNVDGKLEKARRLRLEPTPIVFHDLRLGRMEQVPSEQAGDILLRDRHGHWSYQFAVAVDDLDQGIDVVIRGEDLVASTGRQIQLAQLLGRKASPLFLHHPLIAHPDGRKLSKSNHDTGLRELRALGWTAERVLGQAGVVLGLTGGAPITQAEIGPRILELNRR